MSKQPRGKVPIETALPPETRILLESHGHTLPEYVNIQEAEYLARVAEQLGTDKGRSGGLSFNGRVARWAVAFVLVVGALRILSGVIGLLGGQH